MQRTFHKQMKMHLWKLLHHAVSNQDKSQTFTFLGLRRLRLEEKQKELLVRQICGQFFKRPTWCFSNIARDVQSCWLLLLTADDSLYAQLDLGKWTVSSTDTAALIWSLVLYRLHKTMALLFKYCDKYLYWSKWTQYRFFFFCHIAKAWYLLNTTGLNLSAHASSYSLIVLIPSVCMMTLLFTVWWSAACVTMVQVV